jgi:hypothetical protein
MSEKHSRTGEGYRYFLKCSYTRKQEEPFKEEIRRAREAHTYFFNDGIWEDSGVDEEGRLWMVLNSAPGDIVPFKTRCESTNSLERDNSRDLEMVRGWLGEMQREMVRKLGFIHADPNVGNVLVPRVGEIRRENMYLIDYGVVRTQVCHT